MLILEAATNDDDDLVVMADDDVIESPEPARKRKADEPAEGGSAKKMKPDTIDIVDSDVIVLWIVTRQVLRAWVWLCENRLLWLLLHTDRDTRVQY